MDRKAESDDVDDVKDRARSLAKRALNRQVSAAEWKVATEVAECLLRDIDRAKLIPLPDALRSTLQALRVAGHEVVSKQHLSDLLTALDEYGMGKSFATDSPKLRKVKEALSRLRFTPRLF